MRVALYLRVSTADQNAEAQRRELEQYAARHALEIVRVFEDKGSGADCRRPAMGELLTAARAGRFEAVLVWKLDRFGRSVLDCLNNLEILDAELVRFISITDGIDTDRRNPAAKLFLQILAAAAEFERQLIRERSASGRARYAADQAAGRVGVSVHSKSGKDLPAHRPRRIVDRDRLRKLRNEDGLTLNQIAERAGVSRETVRRRLAESEARA